MDEVGEFTSDQIVGVAVQHVTESRINSAKLEIGTGHGFAEWALFENPAEPVFALSQGRFGCLFLGDIDVDAAETNRHAGGVAQHTTAAKNPAHLAVRPADSVLGFEDVLAIRDGLFEAFDQAFLFFRKAQVSHHPRWHRLIGGRQAHDAEELFGATHCLASQVDIEDADPRRGLGQIKRRVPRMRFPRDLSQDVAKPDQSARCGRVNIETKARGPARPHRFDESPVAGWVFL